MCTVVNFQIGAVMNQNGSTMVIVNSTFVDNVNNNGAIGNRPSGTLTIANTIGGGASPICFNAGTLITRSNLFDDGSCSATRRNPYLAPLDDNGGSTPTHALIVFSDGVGAGDSTYCPATDQRGISRATNCDLGAFEVQTADYLNVCRPGFTGGDTLIFASTGITTTVDTVGSLSQLCVTITETNHPSATPGIQTGLLYWSVNETAASNDWSLTMSAPVTFTLDVNDKLCRYTGTGTVWDCAMTSIDNTNNRITRSGITQLSDWAVGNDVGPSAVTMQSVTTDSASTLWLPVAVATLLLLLTGTAVYRLRRREG